MYGKNIRGCRHLARIIRAYGPKLVLCGIDGAQIIGISYMVEDELYFLNNIIGEHVVIPNEYLNDSLTCCAIKLVCNRVVPLHQLTKDVSGYLSFIVLPDGILQDYDSFTRENHKLIQRCTKGEKHFDNLLLSVYAIVGNSRNLFEWAFRAYMSEISIDTIYHIIYWKEKYGQLTKLLARKTITAYTTKHDIIKLINEQNRLRGDKRLKDSINSFNTEQKKILMEGISVHPGDKKVVASFGHLSKEKQNNFIKKMSTVNSYQEIIENMRLLVKDHFSWDKASFMRFVNGIQDMKLDVIVDNGDTVLAKVDDYETIKYVAKSTNWCISKNRMYWNNYILEGSKQYVLLDFSKPEDDKYSIIGFTIGRDNRMTFAHDYFNTNLITSGDYEDDNIVSYLPFTSPKDSIYSILKDKSISTNILISNPLYRFKWGRDSILEYLYGVYGGDRVGTIQDSQDFLALSIDSDNLNDVFINHNDGYELESPESIRHILFFDFTKDQICPDALLYAVIFRKYGDKFDHIHHVFNRNHDIVGEDELFNFILYTHNIPYNIVQREISEVEFFKSTFGYDTSICHLGSIIKNNRKLKQVIHSVDNSELVHRISNKIISRVSFDELEFIYSNHRKLIDFVGRSGAVRIINTITNSMIEMCLCSDRDDLLNQSLTQGSINDLFDRNFTDEILTRYYGYYYAIKLIMENEVVGDTNLMIRLISNHGLWHYASVHSSKWSVLDFIAQSVLDNSIGIDVNGKSCQEFITFIKSNT